jgi:hypothetical protein
MNVKKKTGSVQIMFDKVLSTKFIKSVIISRAHLTLQPNTSIMKSYLIFRPLSRAFAVRRWQRSDKISPTMGVPQY